MEEPIFASTAINKTTKKSAAKMPRQHPTKEMTAITFQMVIPAVETPPVAVPREEEKCSHRAVAIKIPGTDEKIAPKTALRAF